MDQEDGKEYLKENCDKDKNKIQQIQPASLSSKKIPQNDMVQAYTKENRSFIQSICKRKK